MNDLHEQLKNQSGSGFSFVSPSAFSFSREVEGSRWSEVLGGIGGSTDSDVFAVATAVTDSAGVGGVSEVGSVKSGFFSGESVGGWSL